MPAVYQYPYTHDVFTQQTALHRTQPKRCKPQSTHCMHAVLLACLPLGLRCRWDLVCRFIKRFRQVDIPSGIISMQVRHYKLSAPTCSSPSSMHAGTALL
jgi:hypothetical protein